MNGDEARPAAGGTPDTTPPDDDARADGQPDAGAGEDRREKPRLYVGVGASAGGLEALKQFFAEMSPDTGMTFIVVQHLSPDHKSVMDELLGRHTGLRVQGVEEGLDLRPNTIYLIPPRRNIMLAEGSLYLSERMDDQGAHLQIDAFFNSLASGAGALGVGVILSGTGSDGSRGIVTIKSAGGLVLVQEPTSAKFDGMPVNAVASGSADLVSTPHELAAFLERYATNPATPIDVPPLRAQLATGDHRLDDIFSLLRNECGIDFSQYNASTVARRFERRMVATQTPDVGAYLSLLRTSAREVTTLGRDLLIHVTRFFRDEQAFERLATDVVPALIASVEDDKEIRIWVAGCSTGEEAYSIAILVHEAIERIGKAPRVRLFATDVSAEVIAEAAAGQYGPTLEDEVSAERLARYFVREAGLYTISPRIRRMVVFAQQNLMSDPPFSNLHLICCRNLLIYLQQSTQRKVLASFHFALRDDGFLFLGAAESLGDLADHFETVSSTYRIYSKDEASRPDIPIDQRPRPSAPAPPVRPLLQHYRRRESKVPFEAVKAHLLETFAPTCLVLDQDENLVHVYGDAADYLAPIRSGAITNRFDRLLVPELRTAAQTTLAQVKNGAGPTRCTGIVLTTGSGQRLLELEARRFESPDREDACYALTVVPDDVRTPSDDDVQSIDVNEQTLQRIRDLEHELARQRENLQIANEELETSNEELQSTNEELMSSNEELQSANEELQSVNEELITVNGEHQEKIVALTVAQDDVDNTLALTSTGIVFLDSELRIRKFTSLAGRLFNLMPTDLMRPLRHISNDLDYPSLHEDITEVAETGKAHEKVVQASEGSLILISLLPYNASFHDAHGHGGGVTIALTDLARRLVGGGERQLRALVDRSGVDLLPRVFAQPVSVRLLLVDDRAADRERTIELLGETENLAPDVLEVESLEIARERMRSEPIDVCLVAFHLGAEAIEELAREAASASPPVPVIVLSSLSREELPGRRSGSSATRFLAEEDLSPLMLGLSVRDALELARRRAATPPPPSPAA